MYIKIFFVLCILFVCGCSSGLNSSESWIDYNDVAKIELGMSRDEVTSRLGEPILILADTEYDNTLYVFYNYHIKRYKLNSYKINFDSRVNGGERNTLLKFTFVDQSLSSWEEEKIVLSMSTPKNTAPGGFLIKYFSLLVNLVVLIKIF